MKKLVFYFLKYEKRSFGKYIFRLCNWVKESEKPENFKFEYLVYFFFLNSNCIYNIFSKGC